MHRHLFYLLLASSLLNLGSTLFAMDPPSVTIRLDPQHPEQSRGQIGEQQFPVGLGRKGITEAGKTFRPNHSLLGRFKINAILADERFEMEAELIAKSGKTEAWLRENLFNNMTSIDFDGDGKGGEYGEAVVSLQPLDSKAPQPFCFQKYKGVFRWYSFALHGTQDEKRIGKCATGGCINIGREDLRVLLPKLKLGDIVEITVQPEAKGDEATE